MVQHIVTLFFVIAFFSGVACLSLIISSRDALTRAFSIDYSSLKRFLIIFFCFFGANFIIFYNAFFLLFESIGVIALILFDMLLVSTVYFVIKLNGSMESLIARIYLILGVVYILLWTIVYLVDFSNNLPLEYLIWLVADNIFYFGTITIIFICAYKTYKETVDIWEKRYLMTLDTIFGIYIFWLYCVDTYRAFAAIYIKGGVVYPYLMEPLLIIFTVINIYTIVHFFGNLRKVKNSAVTVTVSDDVEETAIADENLQGLSEREREVIELVKKGMSNPQIAEELSISVYTVKRHMNNIFKKCSVKSRFELMQKLK